MPAADFNIEVIPDGSFKGQHRITHSISGLTIMVYPLLFYPFVPEMREVHVFGDLFGLWHAFETSGLTEHQEAFIPEALMWYAEKQCWPQMDIRAIDPRPAAQISRTLN